MKSKPLNPVVIVNLRWNCVEQNNFPDVVWDDSKDYYQRGNARQCVSSSSGDKRGNLFFVPGQFILPRPESIVLGPILSCIITTEVPTSLEQTLRCPVSGTKWMSLCPSQHIHTSAVIGWKLVRWFCFRNNLHQQWTRVVCSRCYEQHFQLQL